MSTLEVAMKSFIDMNRRLILLANQIDREVMEPEFLEY
jgi:hypothetical protein